MALKPARLFAATAVVLLGLGFVAWQLAGRERSDQTVIEVEAAPATTRSHDLAAPVPGGDDPVRTDAKTRITVHVTDESGRALAGVEVHVIGEAKTEPLVRAKTNAQGRLACDLPRGVYVVFANPWRASWPALTAELQRTTLSASATVELTLRARRSRLVVRVVDDIGRPVKEARVAVDWTRVAAARGWPQIPIPRMTLILPDKPIDRVTEMLLRTRRPASWHQLPGTDAQGFARFANLPAGRAAVAVTTGTQSFGWALPRRSSKLVTLRAGREERVTFRLERKGRVRVVLDRDAGEGFDVTVSGFQNEGDYKGQRFRVKLRGSRHQTTGEALAAPGTYDVTWQVPRRGAFALDGARRISVAPGATATLDLRVRRTR